MKIGLEHHNQLESLRGVLTDLAEISSGEFVGAFEKKLEELDQWKARIAAIGQVKAGKSSTLNALIGDIGFLPSNVNPWTSVVTSMRINVPGDPQCGARFEFFDESDWDRVINGDPRIRNAAEENLPGFDTEVLREQTEEMRANAERRLGKYYHSLLGSQHEYAMLSPDLLQRYVCAGPGADTGLERESLGRYAAITRAAYLFMQSDEYAVPTVIMDTPGVNDPFLVRDEFTCRSLDQSDIFLMTLSAHQALTEVDIALIRMVAQQGDKDVIIYVNRIDELENYPSRTTRIVADITKRLTDAIPDAPFTVAFGSARWAELAINEESSESEIEEIIADPLFDEFLETHRGSVPADVRDKLMLASGIPEIKRTISSAIETGYGARFLDRAKTDTNTQIAALKTVAERKRRDLMDQIESYGAGQTEQFRESLHDEVVRLEEINASLDELFEGVSDQLDTIVNEAWVTMQRSMDKQTGSFIKDQSSIVENLMSGNDVDGEELSIELLPLRVAMEERVAEQYRETRETVDGIMEGALADAFDCAKQITEGLDSRISMAQLPGDTVAVTFATTQKMLSLNFVSKRGWAFWKKNKDIDKAKTVEALKKVTSSEVSPATTKMVEAFITTISDRVTAGKERLHLVKQIVEQSISDRAERLSEDQAILMNDDDESGRAKTINRFQNDIEVLDAQLLKLAAKESLLATPAERAAA